MPPVIHYTKTEYPILKFAKDRKTKTVNDLYEFLADFVKLPTEKKQIIVKKGNGSEPQYQHDVRNKMTVLKDNGLVIKPSDGEYSITPKGLARLKEIEPQTNKLNGGVKKKSIEYNLNKKSFSINNLYFEPEQKDRIIRQVISALINGKHIILIGPPGTGKSKLAKMICKEYSGSENYMMCTATSEWSTFDTIGGYRLNKKGDLEFSPGIFLQCFQDRDFNQSNKWIILDEINRADIDKAFGSLFSALTGDTITIPFERSEKIIQIVGNHDKECEPSQELFIIPKSWRIIATMNTFDKSSLYEMSYAFMRRFAFISIEVPIKIDDDIIRQYVKVWKLAEDNEIIPNLSKIWTIINERRKIGPAIIEDLYRHLLSTKLSGLAYSEAIIMYVFPQFEGLSDEHQISFIKDLIRQPFIDRSDGLKQFASDFFGIDIRKFD